MLSATATLDVARPFSLKATVLSHGWHECAPMSWSEGGRCFQVIERDRGHVYRVSIVETGQARRKAELRMTIEGAEMGPDTVDRITGHMRFILGLDRDLSEFYAICRDHRTLHVIPKIGAGRSLRSPRMTENIIKALCATNINWTQAVKIINRIGQLGPPLRHFVNLNGWPTPREILRAGEDYLRDVCRLGYRVDSILEFCADVCEGRRDPESLIELAASGDVTSDEILAQLRAIRGIGPSSAHYLLSFLGRHDRISIDSITMAHVAHTHMNGVKPTRRQIEQAYEPYGRWKNLVWWSEHWLSWDTARGLLAEAGLSDGAVDGARRGR